MTAVESVDGECAPIYFKIPLLSLDLLLLLFLFLLKAHFSQDVIVSAHLIFLVVGQKFLIFMVTNFEIKALTTVQKIILDLEMIILFSLHQMLESV